MTTHSRVTEDLNRDLAVSLWRMPNWYRAMFSADLAERFSFYGLQAVLVLYAAGPRSGGGLGLAATDAAALFGAWMALTYTLALPGGWMGDRVLGQRPAMLVGCVLSALGLALLAVPTPVTAAAGLCALAVGSGLFKPNQQALVNRMFGAALSRESGISLLYVATQLSALAAPVLVGLLGERVNWSLAFLACALAVLLAGGRIAVAARTFGETGARPARPLSLGERRQVVRRATAWVLTPALALIVLVGAGGLPATLLVGLAGALSVVLTAVGYLRLYRNPELSAGDRRRLRAFLAVFLGTTMFWMIAGQAGSLLNLFGRDHVDRAVFGFVVPASWLQALIPLAILLLAPVITVALPRLGRRHNVAVKFGCALVLVGVGFLVMSVAAVLASGGRPVSPWWLVAVYLVVAMGEVIIAAVAIAATADVLPAEFLGRVLGLYWLFAALGGGVGSGLVRVVDVVSPPAYYLGLGALAVLAGVAFGLGRARLTRALSASAGAPGTALPGRA